MIKYIIRDFFAIFFPRVCVGCGRQLFTYEEFYCTICRMKIPKTNFHLENDNSVKDVLLERYPVVNAAAYCYFRKSGSMQKILHELKYNNNPEIGVFLGKEYGRQLLDAEWITDIDFLIPVPLHNKKLKKRGYNQALMIAKGIADITEIEIEDNTLKKVSNTSSQTKKNRIERWLNIEEAYQITYQKSLENKHVLLIDDVLTTGSTLEACMQKLSIIKGIKISVVCIAVANR